MSYLVLALKWRPQRFSDVVGQEPVSRTLSNALKTGRAAHAYLFSGPRGVGKTTMARILAKALNCERGPADEPCNECRPCLEITSGRAMDVIEIPLTIGLAIGIVAPVLAAIGSLAALVTKCTLVIERVEDPE